jgi:hypothetical protein
LTYGFSPRAYKVKIRFQIFLSKSKLYRYTTAMETTVAPGQFITEAGEPATAAYYILHGAVVSNSVWAASAVASAEYNDGDAESDGSGIHTDSEAGSEAGSAAGAGAGRDGAVTDDEASAAAGGDDATSAEADDGKNTDAGADVQGTTIIPGLIVGMIPLTLNFKQYVSSAKAAGKHPAVVLELKPAHIQALLQDPELGTELNKYASAYTVKAAQGRAKVGEGRGLGGMATRPSPQSRCFLFGVFLL